MGSSCRESYLLRTWQVYSECLCRGRLHVQKNRLDNTMEIVVIAFIVAVIICMLVEFRHKFFQDSARPGEASARPGCFLSIVLILLVLVVVVPFVVNIFIPDDNAGLKPERPGTPLSMSEDREQDYLKEPEYLQPDKPALIEVSGVVSQPEEPFPEPETTSPVTDGHDETPDSGPVAGEAEVFPVRSEDPAQETTPHAVGVDTAREQEESGLKETAPPGKALAAAHEEPLAGEKTTVIPEEETSAGKLKTPAAEQSSSPQSQVMISDEKGGRPFTILIGSYETQEKAFEVASRFATKGDPAYTSYYTDPYEGTRYQVLMGNYKTMEDADAKGEELRQRKFRQVSLTNLMFTVQVGDCSSYPVSEEIKLMLKHHGYLAYSLLCPEKTGYIRVLVGAYLNDKFAKDAAIELLNKGLDYPVKVMLR